jgi:hypothetical protein
MEDKAARDSHLHGNVAILIGRAFQRAVVMPFKKDIEK